MKLTITIHSRLILTLFATAFTVAMALAQETFVVGQVKNAADKSPLPSVSVYFKNTKIAVSSNNEGYFAIRNTGKESTLVFSSIGFKTRELKLKVGSSVGVDVELEELSTELSEVLVIPGVNDSWEWVKKIRNARKINDVTVQKGFNQQSREQNLVLLSKVNTRNTNKRLFEQLKKGNLSGSDSTLAIPLYISENNWQRVGVTKTQISKNIFNSDELSEKIIEKLFGELNVSINFYTNSVTILDKSFISPLANVGNGYYNYYLVDSIQSQSGKQYTLKFKPKNAKDLAFYGQLQFDSATLSLTGIQAELSPKANINFIQNLHINQKFSPLPNQLWLPATEELTMKMNYQVSLDSLNPNPEIFVKRSAVYHTNDSITLQTGGFANSKYSIDTLSAKADELANTPLMRTARYIAKVIFTGYLPVGVFDIGKVQTILRYTDIEGVRLNLPFATNDKLWKNSSIGGHVGYGFDNQKLKYSGGFQYKFPGDNKTIIGVKYCDDYRLNNFDYNNFVYSENTLVTGDEDFATTIMGFRKGTNLSNRKEYSATVSRDWNSDIESNLFIRSNQLYSNSFLPMTAGINAYKSIQHQSATLETRISFDEHTYEDHLRRIYLQNYSPVFYGTVEYGNYAMGNVRGNYGKLMGAMKQKVRFDIGMLNYLIEGSWLIGKVPYPLLYSPHGNDIAAYSFYGFNTMRQMEFVTDKYISLHTELTLNGLLLNRIPLIKNFNLRELCTFHMMYGDLSNAHSAIMDIPNFTQALKKPYMEVGVGVSNIFKLFAIQSIWRLSQLDNPNIEKWELMTSFCVSF